MDAEMGFVYIHAVWYLLWEAPLSMYLAMHVLGEFEIRLVVSGAIVCILLLLPSRTLYLDVWLVKAN